MQLYEEMKERVMNLTRSQYAIKVLDALFDRPVFQSGDFIDRAGIPKGGAYPFLQTLRESGVLHVLREGSGRRSAIYAFKDLLNKAEGGRIL
jgi:hypothetical protein